MPVTYTNSLGPTQFPAFRKSFRWVDDPAEDDDFVAFVREAVDESAFNPPDMRVRELAVDRSGAEPVLTWEKWDEIYVPDPEDEWSGDYVWQHIGTGARPIGPPGTIWRVATALNSSELGYVGAFPMTGYWECDEHGRAYNLSDLVVPS